MAFRGYFALDGVEFANSSRVVAHIGANIPTMDLGLLGDPGDCSLTPVAGSPLLAELPASTVPIGPGRLLGTVPDGTRLYGPGLGLVGDCWTPDNLCFGCRDSIGYDDSWPGLADLLDDSLYRPELAPWYTTRVPESAEFGGVWVMDVKGLDTTPTQRDVTEVAGAGGAPGPVRNPSRQVTFDALLVACTNAGLTYGLQWLTCLLRATDADDGSTLRYLAAHPGGSTADPVTLIREVHGVVLSQEPQVQDAQNLARGQHSQATVYRVQWTMTVTRPYAYSPPVDVAVDWDETTLDPINWIHGADCKTPASCDDMPVFFAEGCDVEPIEVVTTPPPTCGGCMPVCAVQRRVFELPVFDSPYRCRQTAVTLRVRNNGEQPLTLQAFYRQTDTREQCGDQLWPIQLTGVPSQGEVVLDGISGRFWLNWAGRKRRPFNMVSTMSGVPWRPAVIDRDRGWELVVISDGAATFDVSMSLADREV
ncbi:minor tail protein [Mycobacterium phage Nigel]|uniref:Minor tail protein n=1 Tax=Mycobacterium phage Nigel TaxID=543152 RepID=B3VLV3_9CAUD|nr:gp24 [Mycobacterium phage Nigel]ACF05027.1 minor tail protein [Mycobacterium phage Nigel]